MTRVTYAKGVTAASIAAGPLVALRPIATSLTYNWGELGQWLMVAPLILAFTLPFSFALSLLPNAIGAALLGRAGRGNIGLRLWPVWAMAGAGLGWTIDWALALANGHGEPSPLFALVGLPCALICRWGTRWAD